MNNQFALLIIIFLLIAGGFYSTSAQEIRYVKPGGNGDGSSWAAASGDLKATLSTATNGMQVWVAAGTYYPVNCLNCTVADRDQHFEIHDGVQVYGGFAGAESSLDERNWQLNPVFLHGDIDNDNTPDNNSYNILYTRNVSSGTLLDGFIVTMGNADDTQSSLGNHRNSGAGWYNDGALAGYQGHPTIRNCTFINNHSYGYAGAIYNDGGFQGAANPLIEYCVFSNNSSDRSGGAVANIGEFTGLSSPVFNHCIFTENTSMHDGGAVYNMSAEGGISNPLFYDCVFQSNQASEKGGSVHNFGKNGICMPVFSDCLFAGNEALSGGAIYCDGTFGGQCNPSLEDCTFENQLTVSDGGVLYNAAFQGEASPVITRCYFRNNHAGGAGAVLFNNGDQGYSEPVITNCHFDSNIADTYGGAMYNQGKNGHSSPVITNSIFYNNSANSAGAIYNLGAEGGHADAVITNCTFYGNNANVGGAVYCNASDAGNSTPVITNCIFKNNIANFGSVFRCIYGTPFIQYSLVDMPDCNSLNSGAGSNVSCGEGMLYGADPMFAAPDAGDFHQSPVSLVVDAGFNGAVSVAYDLDLHPRIINNTVDLGAYEYGAFFVLPLISTQPQGGDICVSGNFTLQTAVDSPSGVSYQWYRNDALIAGAEAAEYNIISAEITDAGAYFCSISNAGGTVYSDTVLVSVHPNLDPAVIISASDVFVCDGDPVTFNASIVNGGEMPVLQWLVNGEAEGDGTPVFISNNFENSDVVTCQMVSNASCVTSQTAVSDPLTIMVGEVVTPVVEIADPGITICEGAELALSANVEYAGAAPDFEWYLNGQSVGTGQTIMLQEVEDGDEIYCVLTSSMACTTTSSVESNHLLLETTPLVSPFIYIIASDTSICPGDIVTFTSVFTFEGENPEWEWFVNGVSTGVTDNIFISQDLNDGDLVRCFLTSSEVCVTEQTVNSASIEMEVCVPVQEMVKDSEYLITYPNPFSVNFTILLPENESGGKLTIYDMSGKRVLEKNINAGKTIIDSDGLPSGLYRMDFRGSQPYHSYILKVN